MNSPTGDADRNDQTDQTQDWPAGPRPEPAETRDWPTGPRPESAETRDWPTGPPRQHRRDSDVDHTRLSSTTPPGIYRDDTVEAARYFRDQQPPPRWDRHPQQPGWSAGQPPLGAAPSEPTWSAPPPGRPGYPPPHQPFSHDAPTWTAPPGLLSGQLPAQPPPRRGRLAALVAEHRPWWLLGGAAAAIAVVVAAIVIVAGSDDDAPTGATASTAPQVPASDTGSPDAPAPAAPTNPGSPPPVVVDKAALDGLLLPADRISQLMNTTAMTTVPIAHRLLPGAATPPHCIGTWGPAYETTYADSGFTAVAAQAVFRDPTHKVAQAVIAFPDADAAKTFYDKQISDWNACKSTHVRFDYLGTSTEIDVGVPVVTGDVLALLVVPTTTGIAGQQCERDMTVRANVIVDVRACSPTVGSAGSSMVREIADKITKKP